MAENKYYRSIVEALQQLSSPEQAEKAARFFKSKPGEYGEGDHFIGVNVPTQKGVANASYQLVSLSDVQELLNSNFHEHRLTALFILVLKLKKAKKDIILQQQIVELYLKNLQRVNNWDLVDSSAHFILGPYYQNKPRAILKELASSGHIWSQRVAIIATLHFIRLGQFRETLEIAKILLTHEHDLIHKAVGWMLREVGNRDRAEEIAFLDKHYRHMPRTMLRYAIEKFPEVLRKKYLQKK